MIQLTQSPVWIQGGGRSAPENIFSASAAGDIRFITNNAEEITTNDSDGWTPMMYAASFGKVEAVKKLAEMGADVSQANKYGWTALSVAAMWDKTDTVKALLALKADINVKDRNGRTPVLLWAANSYSSDSFKTMIAAGADINAVDNEGKTALILAADNGSSAAVKALIAQKASLNASDANGDTALIMASRNGDKEDIVGLLIKEKADVNAIDRDGHTAMFYAQNSYSQNLKNAGANQTLFCAAKDGDVPFIKAFKGDINIKGKDGRNALLEAAYDGKTKAVIALIDAGADVNNADKNSKTPLMYAAVNGDAVKALLDAKTDIKAIDNDGKTPLMWAVIIGHMDPVKALIKAGSDVNAADRDGRTPLMWAAYSYQTKAVSALIDAKANEDLTDKNGRNALSWAYYSSDMDAVKILMADGAKQVQAGPDEKALLEAIKTGDVSVIGSYKGNINTVGIKGQSALMLAVSYDKPDSVRALIKAGIDANAVDKKGRTALMFSSIYSFEDCARALIESGANVNMADYNGFTALMWSVYKFKMNEGGYGGLLGALVTAAAEAVIDYPDGLNVFVDPDLIHDLLEVGADVNAVSKSGSSAMDIFNQHVVVGLVDENYVGKVMAGNYLREAGAK